jgi:hypothetical protein
MTSEEIAQARRLCERLAHVLRVAPPAPGQLWRMVHENLLDDMAALLPRLLDALEAAEVERDAAYDACAALGWRTPADETLRAERDALLQALRDAIRRPMGVVPDSAARWIREIAAASPSPEGEP